MVPDVVHYKKNVPVIDNEIKHTGTKMLVCTYKPHGCCENRALAKSLTQTCVAWSIQNDPKNPRQCKTATSTLQQVGVVFATVNIL